MGEALTGWKWRIIVGTGARQCGAYDRIEWQRIGHRARKYLPTTGYQQGKIRWHSGFSIEYARERGGQRGRKLG